MFRRNDDDLINTYLLQHLSLIVNLNNSLFIISVEHKKVVNLLKYPLELDQLRWRCSSQDNLIWCLGSHRLSDIIIERKYEYNLVTCQAMSSGHSPRCVGNHNSLSGISDPCRRTLNHYHKFSAQLHYHHISNICRTIDYADKNHTRRDTWNLLSDCSLKKWNEEEWYLLCNNAKKIIHLLILLTHEVK